MKRENPYTRLKRIVKKWAFSVLYPQRKSCYYWSKNRLNQDNGYRLDDVYERTIAAQTLGWHIRLEADEKGLRMVYVKNPDPTPWEIR